MKKFLKILPIALSAIFVLLVIGRLTNAIQYYSVPTRSNEPTIKTGSHFLASKLISPKRLDFICYKSSVPEYENQPWFHRLCGMPGDTVIIKDGDLFINGISQDQSLNLKKMFKIQRDLVASLNFEEGEVIPMDGTDSVIANLETITHKDLIKQARLHIDNHEYDEIKKIYGQPWSLDNFGPFIVPADSYFVIGDNRHYSNDSRFSGPVKKENYLTTILGK